MRCAEEPGPEGPKPIEWMGSTRHDIRSLPDRVQDVFGYGLFQAQDGGKADDAKPLQGFGGAGVLEIVEDYDGQTYRAVYTVRFARAIYVLHVFQRKSKRGAATPAQDVELIRTRLRMAREHHESYYI